MTEIEAKKIVKQIKDLDNQEITVTYVNERGGVFNIKGTVNADKTGGFYLENYNNGAWMYLSLCVCKEPRVDVTLKPAVQELVNHEVLDSKNVFRQGFVLIENDDSVLYQYQNSEKTINALQHNARFIKSEYENIRIPAKFDNLKTSLGHAVISTGGLYGSVKGVLIDVTGHEGLTILSNNGEETSMSFDCKGLEVKDLFSKQSYTAKK